MADLERTLAATIRRLSQEFRVILLTGQRQVGKSTLLKNLAAGSERAYVSLDNLAFRKLAKEDPGLFLQHNPPPVTIDEAQYAPELFPYIKIHVDEHPEQKGAFWLTGSQKYRLMEGVRESLAGRVAILELLGLSDREKRAVPQTRPFLPSFERTDAPKLAVTEIYRRIWEGSLPEPALNPRMDREIWYGSYVQSYIERDVRDFYNISKPIQFFDFLTLVAAQTGGMLNYASLGRDIGVDTKTAQAWIGVLERSGLIWLLRPYAPNITQRIVKTPKVYFSDTGLCAYLTRWTTPDTLMSGAMAGVFLETYVMSEILKSYLHNGREPPVWFYRDADKREIDLILERDGALYPVEIKKTANPGRNDFRSFAQLDKLDKKRGLGAIVCLQGERLPINREVVSIPVWEI